MHTTNVLKAMIGGGVLAVSATSGVMALDDRHIVTEQCASCHNLTGPAPGTFKALLKRRAPDLFYAGSKFNRPWLVEWLQKPTVIRRSGVTFLNHIVTEGGKDTIRKASVKPCAAKLSPEEAKWLADYLMTLKDAAMKTAAIDPTKKFRKAKARRMFTKQFPCVACHMARFGKRTKGGISGPDLREAGKRLNPDWVYARIENPQYWDPKTWMPNFALSHKKREILTLFVSSMK